VFLGCGPQSRALAGRLACKTHLGSKSKVSTHSMPRRLMRGRPFKIRVLHCPGLANSPFGGEYYPPLLPPKKHVFLVKPEAAFWGCLHACSAVGAERRLLPLGFLRFRFLTVPGYRSVSFRSTAHFGRCSHMLVRRHACSMQGVLRRACFGGSRAKRRSKVARAPSLPGVALITT